MSSRLGSEKLEDWVALSLMPGLGPGSIRRAIARFGDPGDVAHRVPVPELRAVLGLRDPAVSALAAIRPNLRRLAENEIRRAERHGIALVTSPDPRYPAALAEIPDPPPILYMRGRLDEGIVRVAIVGSRRASAYGRRVAVGLAAGLAARGVEVVSGGARGIDTCAHRGALEGEGRTVAVLGSGFLDPYPPENVALFEEIAERGALLGEFPLDAPPRAENFPRRNRLLSGLSAAVVVVEAALRSGSLTTAAHALDQGREVMAVPGPVSSDQSAGCHRLIQQGARLVQRVEDVLEELSPMYAAAVGAPPPDLSTLPGSRPLRGLTPDEEAILALLRDDPEPVHLEGIVESAPFGVARVQAALFGLEARSAVEQLPGGYYLARSGK